MTQTFDSDIRSSDQPTYYVLLLSSISPPYVHPSSFVSSRYISFAADCDLSHEQKVILSSSKLVNAGRIQACNGNGKHGLYPRVISEDAICGVGRKPCLLGPSVLLTLSLAIEAKDWLPFILRLLGYASDYR